MKMPRPLTAMPQKYSLLLAGLGRVHAWAGDGARAPHALAIGILPAVFLSQAAREDIYNILWALVFAFATLNILSLGARRLQQDRGGLTFGEVVAIMVVVVSILMLGWEMLYVFHILPIRLTAR
ncbi:MAG: hypothetical protein WCC22_10145 [Terriglobales bacterium]